VVYLRKQCAGNKYFLSRAMIIRCYILWLIGHFYNMQRGWSISNPIVYNMTWKYFTTKTRVKCALFLYVLHKLLCKAIGSFMSTGNTCMYETIFSFVYIVVYMNLCTCLSTDNACISTPTLIVSL